MFLRYWLTSQNKKKDRLVGEVSQRNTDGVVHSFEDFTDRENPNFRYIY
jgi:hypothetical protein